MKTKYTLIILFAGFCVAGCSSEEKTATKLDQTNIDQADEQANSISDAAWARSILEQSAKWDTITPEPVNADPDAYALCRSPDPSDLKPTLHNPQPVFNPGNFASDAGSDSGPNAIPTNQFAVNAIAQPHFKMIPAKSWLSAMDIVYPVGSIIVKEKYDDIDESTKRGRANAIAVMTKQSPGYDPQHGDWEYGYIELDKHGQANSITRGKISSCIDCHSNRSTSDYVFRDYLITR